MENLILSSILAVAVSIATNFLLDRFRNSFFQKSISDKIIETSPYIELDSVHMQSMNCSDKSFFLNIHVQKNNNKIEKTLCLIKVTNELINSLNTNTVKKIRIINNTNTGVCIDNLIFDDGSLIAIDTYRNLDAGKEIIFYIDFMTCPKEIKMHYNQYHIYYSIKNDNSQYIRPYNATKKIIKKYMNNK